MKTGEEIEKAAEQKQKEPIDEYGMLGFLFNPYEPFDVELVDMWKENKTLCLNCNDTGYVITYGKGEKTLCYCGKIPEDQLTIPSKTPWCNICDRPVEYCRCEK